ncbi:hypothetical protein NPIL_415991 [Nephila pilipes]|uniref:Uncharacterized protein n=1 Tax=Nephila pilipes TaxID=299642 RepID=A0A8X6R0M7_NEPPI|nr:hypothetical protein NPIL_415991 [Nephila pilipes]
MTLDDQLINCFKRPRFITHQLIAASPPTSNFICTAKLKEDLSLRDHLLANFGIKIEPKYLMTQAQIHPEFSHYYPHNGKRALKNDNNPVSQ